MLAAHASHCVVFHHQRAQGSSLRDLSSAIQQTVQFVTSKPTDEACFGQQAIMLLGSPPFRPIQRLWLPRFRTFSFLSVLQLLHATVLTLHIEPHSKAFLGKQGAGAHATSRQTVGSLESE